jgi:hypothetical protein
MVSQFDKYIEFNEINKFFSLTINYISDCEVRRQKDFGFRISVSYTLSTLGTPGILGTPGTIPFFQQSFILLQ